MLLLLIGYAYYVMGSSTGYFFLLLQWKGGKKGRNAMIINEELGIY